MEQHSPFRNRCHNRLRMMRLESNRFLILLEINANHLDGSLRKTQRCRGAPGNLAIRQAYACRGIVIDPVAMIPLGQWENLRPSMEMHAWMVHRRNGMRLSRWWNRRDTWRTKAQRSMMLNVRHNEASVSWTKCRATSRGAIAYGSEKHAPSLQRRGSTGKFAGYTREVNIHHKVTKIEAAAKEIPVESGFNVEELVERAVYSACAASLFFFCVALKAEAYLSYFLPLPVILAVFQRGVDASWKLVVSTSLLVFTLLGPLKACQYILQHGILGFALGILWNQQQPWSTSIMVGATVRALGMVGTLVIASYLVSENLFNVLVAQVVALLDQCGPAMGMAGSPPLAAVGATLVVLLFINGISYCFILHIFCSLILNSMGFKAGKVPRTFAERLQGGFL